MLLSSDNRSWPADDPTIRSPRQQTLGGTADRHIRQPACYRGLGILPAAAMARIPCRAPAALQPRTLDRQPVSGSRFPSRGCFRPAPLRSAHGAPTHLGQSPMPGRPWRRAFCCSISSLRRASVRAGGAALLALSRAASFGSRCRCDDLRAPSSRSSTSSPRRFIGSRCSCSIFPPPSC